MGSDPSRCARSIKVAASWSRSVVFPAPGSPSSSSSPSWASKTSASAVPGGSTRGPAPLLERRAPAVGDGVRALLQAQRQRAHAPQGALQHPLYPHPAHALQHPLPVAPRPPSRPAGLRPHPGPPRPARPLAPQTARRRPQAPVAQAQVEHRHPPVRTLTHLQPGGGQGPVDLPVPAQLGEEGGQEALGGGQGQPVLHRQHRPHPHPRQARPHRGQHPRAVRPPRALAGDQDHQGRAPGQAGDGAHQVLPRHPLAPPVLPLQPEVRLPLPGQPSCAPAC